MSYVDELLERLRTNPPPPLDLGPSRLTQAEIDSLTRANGDDEWNAACDAAKAARGGEYPSDWNTNTFTRGLCSLRGAYWADR